MFSGILVNASDLPGSTLDECYLLDLAIRDSKSCVECPYGHQRYSYRRSVGSPNL